MRNLVHEFDNHIKVYDRHLLDLQRERYAKNNLHEPEEESLFLDAISGIPTNGVYVNIGAAIGYYPILAALHRDDLRISAYEPLRLHRKYFKQNIKLNGLRATRFKIYKEGIYTKKCSTSFMVKDYRSMIKTGDGKKGLVSVIKEKFDNSAIKCITLRDVAKREGGEIGFMQMDIQGLEADILESEANLLSKHAFRLLLIGTHGEKIHKRCVAALTKAGYKILYDEFETKLQPDGIIMAGVE